MLRWTEDQAQIIKWGNRKEEIYRELGRVKGIPLVPGTETFVRDLSSAICSNVHWDFNGKKNIEMAIQQIQLGGLLPVPYVLRM